MSKKPTVIGKAVPVWICFLALFSAALAANPGTGQKQAELDAACERAREARLAPMRKKYVDECVEKKQRPDRASCERFYADFGGQSGNRAPLFYDLPECVEAFEHRQKNRSR